MAPYLALTGRLLYSVLFVVSALGHFRNAADVAALAASRGMPLAWALTLGSGGLLLVGGLLILFGWKTRLGSMLLLLFLVPTTLVMHNPLNDPTQMAHFLKNLALIGGALLLLAHGAGPLSLDGVPDEGATATGERPE